MMRNIFLGLLLSAAWSALTVFALFFLFDEEVAFNSGQFWVLFVTIWAITFITWGELK